jgi:signal transduction histidine kinase
MLSAGVRRVVGRRADLHRLRRASGVVLRDDAGWSAKTMSRPLPASTVAPVHAPAPTTLRRRVRDRFAGIDAARAEMTALVLLGVEFQVEAWIGVPGPVGRHIALSALCLIQTAGMLLGRRRPIAGVALVLAPQVVYALMPATVIDHLSLVAVAPVVVCLSLGARTVGRRLWAGGALAAALELTSTVLDHYPNNAGKLVLTPVLVVGGPIFVGRAIRDRRALNAALRRRAAQVEADRAARAQEAVLQERARMADELHDVIAHSLSAMVVQAAGARRLLATQPDRARTAFESVEVTGREALTDVRRLLGVLRRDDEELALAPHPSLALLDSLIRRAAAEGFPITLTIEGDRRRLSPGSDLVAYRVVQEALAGARTPGGATSATVRLGYGANHLDVEVLDNGPAGTGPPLGIRERVLVYGGDLQTGPGPDGSGHAIRARLPIGTAP